MASKIKLPLSSYGFPFLCDFIKLINAGLKIVSEGVDDNAAEITALTNEIINGEVTAALAIQDGSDVIATRTGVEIQAVRIL